MSQGVVTKFLISLVTRQVDEHSLVVWYDSEEQYQDVAATLTLPETRVARYTDSFFV